MRKGARSDGRLRLTIIAGFLGAGKSTWLRHQLHENTFGSVHVFVNEAAEMPVDNLLLGKADRISVLAGGCACCEGRATLVEALRNTCQEQDGADAQPIDRILLETSGLADPGAIAKALSEDPILARRLVLDETIVLVDALHGLAQLNEERLGRRQVEAADRLIITKPGSVAASQLARMASTLRQLNPMALVESAERGTSFALQTVPDAEPYPLADIADDAMPIKPCRLDISGEYGWAAFSVWLSALLAARGEQIMRVKGVVTTADGRLLLQSVRKQVQPPEMLPEMDADSSVQGPRDNIIIFIGRGIDDALLTSAWARFTQDNPGQMRR